MNKANAELIKLAQEIARIGSWEVDLKNSKLTWGDITYQIHEVPLNTEIKLEDAINYYIEEHRPIIQQCVQNAICSGEPYDVELQIKTQKGKIKWVRAIGRAVFKNDELVRIEGVFQDVHEKKTQEVELSNLLERHDLAMSNSGFGIWDWDVTNNLLNWDDKMFEIYGISKKNFSSAFEAWSAGLHPEDKKRSELEVKRALKNGKPFNQDFRIITETGEVRHIGTISKVIKDASGTAVRMIGMNWNKSQEIQDREKLLKLNEELVQFSYRTSHDLKSPLNSIKGITALALDDLKNKEYGFLEKDLTTIDQQIDRLTKLVQDMMDLTKIDNLETSLTPIDIKVLIEKIKQNEIFQLKKEKIQFEMDIERDLYLYSDKVRLTHILSNLIDNCIKYSDDKKENKLIQVKAYTYNEQVHVEIKDNGVGIPAQYHSQVFQMFKRFYQKKDGTGLGLYMIKKNIETLKGEISFESSVEGTTFRMKFPLRKKWMAVG